jgi:heme oxygenase
MKKRFLLSKREFIKTAFLSFLSLLSAGHLFAGMKKIRMNLSEQRGFNTYNFEQDRKKFALKKKKDHCK